MTTPIHGSPDHVDVYCTAQDSGERLTRQDPVPAWRPAEPTIEGAASITVDAGVRLQRIEGFGGAFTEAAAVTWLALPPARRAELLRAYFNPEHGHGYTLCRTHMNSCDFSTGNYACAEAPDDWSLKHFNVDRDRRALLPMIQEAQRVADPGFRLFVSPWSPPAWMKTTGMMNLGGSLRVDCRDAWALHYVKFIEAYRDAGVPVWGLTVQNEPRAKQRWDSCEYTAEEERDFVRDHLGPALERAGMGDVKIIVWDHNRNLLYERVKPVYEDARAARYVWGAGVHWYMADCFANLQAVHDRWPDKALLFTEGCQEGGPHLGEWAVGERYGRSIINDLNHWAAGWVDWNLLINEEGGPNHVGNFCSAPVIADRNTGDLMYQSSYYYIGHFSRFIRPGAHRIIAAVTVDEVEATAVINPDGGVVVVAMNRTSTGRPLTLRYEGWQVTVDSKPRSIVTCRFRG